MVTRTYWAETLAQAMKKAQDELGPEAVILDTRESRDPNARRGKLYAVTAAAGYVRPAGSGISKSIRTSSLSKYKAAEKRDGVNTQPVEEDLEMAESILSQLDQLQEELIELRTARGQWEQTSKTYEALRIEMESLSRAMNSLTGGDVDVAIDSHVMDLVRGGVDRTIAETVMARAKDRGDSDDVQSPVLSEEIAASIPVTQPLWGREEPVCAALIGPSGVGKTVTLAKIAAEASYVYDQKVGVISVDGFRVGRSELIKGYCELLEIPLRMARNRDEFQRSLAAFSDCDLVLIDTWGHNPWNDESIAELNQFLQGISVERHLVVSATWRSSDIRDLVARYQEIDSLVLTKIDEARGPAAVLAATWDSRYAVSHICSGQEVLEDIVAADQKALAEQILAHAA